MIYSTFRIIKLAWESFWRNVWLSVVTIVILVLTLFLISLTTTLNIVANAAVDSVKEKVDISVFFDPKAQETQVLATRDEIAELNEVKEITYISSEQALLDFQEKHKDDPTISESLEELEENPLGATLVIRAQRLEDYATILTFIEGTTYSSLILDKDFEDTEVVIEKLSRITERIQSIGLTVSIIFIAIAALVIFNTIRITIYTHRDEIGIMKLVGASNWFVRAPFIIESILYALLGTAITLALFYPFISFTAPYINTFFEGYDFSLYSYFSQHFWETMTLQLIIALLLSVISSMVAITRYLKV